jgi:natural product precursor
MKKISLKNVNETLSRKEMRTIAGGYGGSYKCCWTGTTNCSVCVSGGSSCVSGATLTPC